MLELMNLVRIGPFNHDVQPSLGSYFQQFDKLAKSLSLSKL